MGRHHFLRRGDALGLGHRHRVDRVAAGLRRLSHQVDQQIARQRAIVGGIGWAVGGGVAIEHGAGRRVHDGERALEGKPRHRIAEGMAEAMGNARADQLLDHVALDRRGAERRSKVGEPRGEPVVEIGMDQHLDLLRGDQAERAHGGERRLHIVIPMRQAKGEILAEIADDGGAGLQRRGGVLQRRRRAHDEVAEMRRDRRHLGEGAERLRRVEDEPGAARLAAAQMRRIAHAPIEADAVAVGRAAFIDLRPGAAALLRIAIADLGMEHQAVRFHRAALELRFARDAVEIEERAALHCDRCGQRAPFDEGGAAIRQPVGKQRVAREWRHARNLRSPPAGWCRPRSCRGGGSPGTGAAPSAPRGRRGRPTECCRTRTGRPPGFPARR